MELREEKSIKYQVFVSATYQDLQEERKEVVDTVLQRNHFPIGMEMFGAEDEDQWKIITNGIDESDIYVLVIGHRYGSIGKKKSLSFTEMEFDYAVQRSKQKKLKILCFIRDRDAVISAKKIQMDIEGQKKLEAFIEKVKTYGTMVDFWKEKEDLGKKVSVALSKTIDKLKHKSQEQKAGWIKLGEYAEQFEELERLKGIKKVMHDTAQDFQTVNSDNEIYFFDKYGNCKITRTRTQYCGCDLTHTFIQYVSDKDAKGSCIESIIDQTSGKDLQYLIYEHEKNIFSFFILFSKNLKKGDTVRYKFTAKVKNYLHNLIEKGHGTVGYNPFKKTSFSNKKDVFSFPDIPLFAKLNGILIYCGLAKQAPLYQKIPCKKIDGRKTFTINYGALPIGSKIEIEFRLK